MLRTIDATDAVPAGRAAPRFRDGPSRRVALAQTRRSVQELRRALAEHQFVLDHAPRVALASGLVVAGVSTVALGGRRPGAGPGALQAAAACSALVGAIGGWALAQACRDAVAWSGERRVCVSVSAAQLADESVLAQVAAALHDSGLAAERLELGFTEAALAGSGTDALLVLAALRDLGVGIAAEGFGSGLGSLGMLRRVPLTALRLDGGLLRDLPADREDAAIVRAVVATAAALGLVVVAEGVECDAQRACLAEIGVEEAQGPLFGALPEAAGEVRSEGGLSGPLQRAHH